MSDERIQNLGGQPATSPAEHLQTPESERGTAIGTEGEDFQCDLTHYGVVRVSGPDAKPFLQGQCTIDLEEVNQSRARLGAFCNPKGRVLTLALFVLEETDYLLRMPNSQIEPVLERLTRYVLRARVTLTREAEIHAVGLAARDTSAVFDQRPIAPPSGHYETVHVQSGVIIRVPGKHPRFEIYATPEQLARLQQAVAALPRLQPESWDLLNIRAGVPEVYPAASELFIPQMLDLEGLGGISFTKGCYTGQEIVARTQYLGNLKRRLVHARITHGPRPGPGDSLFGQGNSAEKNAAGQILCAAADGRGGFEVLAVVQTAALENKAGHLVTAGEQRLENLTPNIRELDD